MIERVDFLVIGSGIAGLSFALKASKYGRVAVLSKLGADETATKYAQGGIATVFSDEDDFDLHVRDTLVAGAGLCREDVVRHVVESGPARVRELIDWGVEFTRSSGLADEEFDLHLEGGHSRKRILHAKDITGAVIEQALLARVAEHPDIAFHEHHMAIDLITRKRLGLAGDGDRCFGAYVLDIKSGEIRAVVSRATLLASGGSGKVYLITTNPDIASGDGVAMAARAGADIANMEFFQFHPTCLFHPHAGNFLISEAVRGAGAVLVDANGVEFMHKYDERRSLAPRDIVARAIDNEIKVSGRECVYLDFTRVGADEIRSGFPNIHERCARFGIDITRDLIPVAPAAHYQCGGVCTDLNGETTIPGLYAVGEVANTGLHGANRLASNSLLEAVVFSHNAAVHAAAGCAEAPAADRIPDWDPGRAIDSDESIVVTQNWEEIRRFMHNYVGIVRTNRRLRRAKSRIDFLKREIHQYYWHFCVTKDILELRNIAVVADLIIMSAASRAESRGLHYNTDHPHTDDRRPPQDTIIRNYPSLA
ncbi:MAG: L-aspartate oxidase [Deltaproteobacteria bacterium]|nr:L-aspartate oxidase [Deltaproteobacteria bacterium]